MQIIHQEKIEYKYGHEGHRGTAGIWVRTIYSEGIGVHQCSIQIKVGFIGY